MRPIQDRVVAITGGARGIGLATARELVGRGARVALGDLDERAAKAAAAELGGDTLGVGLDVTGADSFGAFLDAVEDRFGPLDVLVNNAGIMPVSAFHTEPDEVARRQVDINVHGVITGSKLALRRMLPRDRGHIVNIASTAGVVGVPGATTYCGTKHAVLGISEGIRLEYRETGIQVTAVLPGVIATGLTSGLPDNPLAKPIAPDRVAKAIARVLERPRSRVYVPANVAVLGRLRPLLPNAALDALMAVTGAKRGFLDHDAAARADYERRARTGE